MPKGQQEKTRMSVFGIECRKAGTKRIFQTEKDLKSYLKRHDKICDCGKNEVTGVVHNYGSRQRSDVVVNDPIL